MKTRPACSWWEAFTSLALMAWLLLPLDACAETGPTVTLGQPVHFMSSEGRDVVVDIGTYLVEQKETSLVLTAEGRPALALEAKPTSHHEAVEAPLAVAIPGEDADGLHLVLVLPNGQAWEAPGSMSGTRARNTGLLLASPAQLQFVVANRVTLYEQANFGGRSHALTLGDHLLSEFNDVASSIKVPNGLIAVLYEHADNGGGYGRFVDLLEDQPDLSRLTLHKAISYVRVFSRTRPGYAYIRNSVRNGRFEPGHWEREPAAGRPPLVIPTVAVVSPPLPSNAPVPSAAGSGAPPAPPRRESKLAKFHMLELQTGPPKWVEGKKLESFRLVYQCEVEGSACTARHDLINVWWAIITPKPELNFNRNYGLNNSGQVLYGAGNSNCPGGIKQKYPRAGCLSGQAFGGVVGAQGTFKVILALKGDGQPDMNDPDTVVMEFLVVMTQPRPYLTIGGPRIRDNR